MKYVFKVLGVAKRELRASISSLGRRGFMRYILVLSILFLSVNVIALEIKSDDFKNGEYIPSKCAYDTLNIPPSLSWTYVPEGTESFAIICEDHDAPKKAWVHWVIINIPKNAISIKESASAVKGINDFGKIGYGGPCPPPGKPHRYYFKLYALDTTLSLKEGVTKDEVLSAMGRHIIGEAEIVGLYKR